ncbi:hypothetical protein [Streptomyces sp. CLV115]|uniref:hypothetical protein n=1 Tax=Streptomyces sp. CLV115 TaxID=3138502 RepID=UPI00406BFBE0
MSGWWQRPWGAIRRDLTAGERAGLRQGEQARRAHDVFAKRPPTHRNVVWEGDHKRVPVQVDVEGELVCPWVTWFIDCATKVIVVRRQPMKRISG